MRDMKLTMHGNGQNTRNFLFVEDVARAFDTVLHKGKIGDIYNIGGKNEFANIDVARMLLKVMGKAGDGSPEALAAAEAEYVTYVPDRPFNDVHYHLDSKKLESLGWREEVTWEEGLRRTVEWYRVNSGNWGDLSGALVAHPRRGLSAAEFDEEQSKLRETKEAGEKLSGEAAAASAVDSNPATVAV